MGAQLLSRGYRDRHFLHAAKKGLHMNSPQMSTSQNVFSLLSLAAKSTRTRSSSPEGGNLGEENGHFDGDQGNSLQQDRSSAERSIADAVVSAAARHGSIGQNVDGVVAAALSWHSGMQSIISSLKALINI